MEREATAQHLPHVGAAEHSGAATATARSKNAETAITEVGVALDAQLRRAAAALPSIAGKIPLGDISISRVQGAQPGMSCGLGEPHMHIWLMKWPMYSDQSVTEEIKKLAVSIVNALGSDAFGRPLLNKGYEMAVGSGEPTHYERGKVYINYAAAAGKSMCGIYEACAGDSAATAEAIKMNCAVNLLLNAVHELLHATHDESGTAATRESRYDALYRSAADPDTRLRLESQRNMVTEAMPTFIQHAVEELLIDRLGPENGMRLGPPHSRINTKAFLEARLTREPKAALERVAKDAGSGVALRGVTNPSIDGYCQALMAPLQGSYYGLYEYLAGSAMCSIIHLANARSLPLTFRAIAGMESFSELSTAATRSLMAASRVAAQV